MCLSKDVTGSLHNYHSPLLVTCFYTGCLSKDATGALLLCFLAFLGGFLPPHSVSVQRRDRSLFFLLLCSTKVQFIVLLGSAFSLLICFWTPSRIFFLQCVCPKTWQVLCFLFYLSQDLLLHSSAFFWSHSVSVQRRDRCSVTYPTHPLFVSFFSPLFKEPFVWLLSLLPCFLVWVFSQHYGCICPKT